MSIAIIPFIVGLIIQGIKVSIDIVKNKIFKREDLWSSGGFPSVHSGVSASIITLTYIIDGTNSLTFAIAVGFSFLLWYDAVNVRYEAGKHARQINIIQQTMKDKQKDFNLKERIGHTPAEVIGGIIAGSLGTFLIYYIPGIRH